MKTAYVCFLWHMHQPYYTDPVKGLASLPWVRLHASKAYFDMAYLLEQFPSIRATFNFTPSLLLQLEEIRNGTVRDVFLDHAEKPAAALSLEEQAFLIRHYFSINWATMIRPYPRYHELLVKRGLKTDGQELERLARQFTTQELLDLQVWFNLAWFGYGAVARYPRLAALRAKNRMFTEEDKQEVLLYQRKILQEIVPMYRRLSDQGQIELTTTPFYHPILPLVIDTENNRRARPDLPLPSRFRAPEDAETQLQRAVEFHTATFGRAPVGLWPSEGSVCPELLPMLPQKGFSWLATDEGILAHSLESSQQQWNRQKHLYRPYRAGSPGQEVSIVFRDREISDAFGFVYHKTNAESAVEDVLRRIRHIVMDAPQQEIFIPIILDGENPWEHYHEGGTQFLTQLYSALTSIHEGAVRVSITTISEALKAVPPRERLSTLHSGSWINHDFKIWIGHREDNRAWDLLGLTRSRLRQLTPTLSPEQTKAAWDELYAAEGSDWFWWYGDDFETAYKEEFDRLFRMHLRNVWSIIGAPPPDWINQSICVTREPVGQESVTQPFALLHPTLDGHITDFFEWRGAGTINPNPPLGAMWKADGLFSAIYFGCSLDHLYLRLDPADAVHGWRDDLIIECHLLTPEHAYCLTLSPSEPDHYSLTKRTDEDHWQEIGLSEMIARQDILELAIPFKDIQLESNQTLGLSIVVKRHGLEIARYPPREPAPLTVPGPDFEATMWRA